MINEARDPRMQAVALRGIGPDYDPDTPPERHVEQVCGILTEVGMGTATLVGDSYGGLVATAAAVRGRGQVARVVVLDGFVAEDGRSIFDMFPQVRSMMEPVFSDSPPRSILPVPAGALGIDDGGTAALVDARSVPMSRATHEASIKQDMTPLDGIERYYVRFTGFPLFEGTRDAAASAGWAVRDIDAGHMAILTHPCDVLRALDP